MTRRLPAALLLCAALPVSANVVLLGEQHIGDTESTQFTPSDPVTRMQMRANPSRFHLSQPTTITAVRFDNAVSLNGYIRAVYIDDVEYLGTLSGNVFTLNTPTPALSAGVHRIAPDPGCLDSSNVGVPCPAANGENDIGFSALTLISAQTTTSRALNRRRHIGDDNEAQKDFYLGDYYPDALEPPPNDVRADMTFSIDSARVLNTVQFYRLRGVNTAAGGHAQVLLNGAFIGELTGNGDPGPFSLNTSLFLGAGTHTLSVVAGFLDPGNRDSISWDDVLLLFSAPVAGTPGRFNAVDPGGNAVSGVIQTKIAGAAFALDIVALNLARDAQLADYAGEVSVQLLDAADDSGALDAYGCRPSWSPVTTLGALIFTAADGGRRSLSPINYGGILRKARLRVTDIATGISGCSTDAFAIRPDRFDLRVSDNTALTAGVDRALNDTGTGGTVTHRAGQPFTMRVRPYGAGGVVILSGYDTALSTPTVSVEGTIAGAVPGVISVQGWNAQNTNNGVIRTNTARYSEAGTFNLRAEDAIFADVDAADTLLADRSIRSPLVGVGRFTPDHFRLVSRNTPSFGPACGTFGYVGQPFGYATAPEAQLQAVSATGTVVLNYEGQLYKLPAAVAGSIYRAVDGTDASAVSLDTAAVPTPGNALDSLGAAQVRLRYDAAAQLAVLREQPVAPIDLEVELEVGNIIDSDGVSYADPVDMPLKFGVAAEGTGIAFTASGNQQRFGRLALRNGYGPETQPLDLLFGAEYFTGSGTGFGRNLADSCTTVSAPTLSDGIAAATSVISTSSPLIAGQGTIRLAAPNQIGSVNLSLSGPAWLGADTNGDNVYAEPATSTATFGQFRESETRIYLRETFR